MAAGQAPIPLSFNTSDPVSLKRDLERMASVLQSYFALLTGAPHASLVQRRLFPRPLNSTTAAFGYFTPVSLPNDTDILNIRLPKPNPQNAGLLLAIRRDTTTGIIHLSAPDCTVNGSDRVELVAEKCFVWVFFDGSDYFTGPGATWTA